MSWVSDADVYSDLAPVGPRAFQVVARVMTYIVPVGAAYFGEKSMEDPRCVANDRQGSCN